ncbi:MAG: AAA family ATPase [Chloroflexi bacterium]|nr:AAA family ATPase [Chloroflexota bacterium]
MLIIKLLGQPRIELNGKLVTVRRRKNRALVYYLAAQTHPRSREHLLGMFWPDLDRASAQQSLRTALHELRKLFEEWLIADGDQLSLSASALVDVHTFEQKLSPPAHDLKELRAALALYEGDFLAGFGLDAAPEFDDWLMTQAERYHRLAVRGLSALAALLESQHNYPAALEALDRALSFDPLQEDLQRTALRIHYLAGDRAGAVRRYDRLRKLLDEEMAVPPMAETRQLYDAILNDTVAYHVVSITRQPDRVPAERVSALPYTGRETELAALQTLFVTVSHKFALIEGEPGIGKTRLAQEFIAQANALALVGSARELERNLPYQPVIEALRSLLADPQWEMLCDTVIAQTPKVWLNEVARLLPELTTEANVLAAAPDEARLWEGISQFLQTLAAHRPVIVFLDDIHWSDSSTLALLGYLIRQTAHAPVTLIAAARPDPAHTALSTLLQSLIRSGQLERFPLARLSAPEIERMAQHLSRDYAYPLAEWLGRVTEGSPYVLAELVRYARENDILQPGGVIDLNRISASPVVPQTIYSLIQERLAHLSDPARRMLDAAVVIGREFEVQAAYRAAGLSESAALDALDELNALSIMHPLSGTRYRFDHNLTMEVAYHEMGELRHRILHRRVAEAIEMLVGRNCEDAAGLIAFHFAEGGEPERAAPYALRAGKQAMQLAAWAEAIRLFELALTPGAPIERRFEALMGLGSAHFRAGHPTQAAENLRDALHVAEHAHLTNMICEARLSLAATLFPQGRYAESVALAAQYPTPHDAASAILAARSELIIGTALSLEGAHLDRAVEHLQRGKTHLQAAVDQDPGAAIDPIYEAHLNFELGSIAAQQGDLAQATTLYRMALARSEQSRDPEALLRTILAHNNLAYHLHLLNDPAAQDYAQSGRTLAQNTGMIGIQPYLYSTSGEIRLAAGDVQGAETFFEQGLTLAEQTQNRERVAGLTANLGLVARQRGDVSLAIHRLSTAMALADTLGTRHLAAQIRLWLAPLLPQREARLRLAEARIIAEDGGRQLLLAEVERLDTQLLDH